MINQPVLPNESIVIGRQAAEIASNALEELGVKIIRQKAQDIARQIEIYLKHTSISSLEEIKRDSELASIAVVQIGESGYSALHDTNANNLFHPEPNVIGTSLRDNYTNLPQFWKIVETGLKQESGGYYDWPDANGQLHRKYMYCVPIFPEQIAPLGLVVATTIFIDEFLHPSREIHDRIITLAERVDEFTRIEQRRNSQLRAINEFSRKISSFLNVDELLPYVAQTMQNAFQIQHVRIFLYRGTPKRLFSAAQAGEIPCLATVDTSDDFNQDVVEQVAVTGKPFLSEEYSPAAGTMQEGSCVPIRMVVPIKIGKNILGVMDLINVDARPFGDADLFSIFPLADQVAVALENARLHHELREMAVLEERNRIAREIHDTLAQGFAGISMQVESAKMALKEQDIAHAQAILDRIRDMAKDKLSEARRSVQSLRPNITIQENLETLIRDELMLLSQDMKEIEVELDVIGQEQPISPPIKLALLRIYQEALNNIKKHAHASQIKVSLTYNKNAVSLLIQDDGIGFKPQMPTSNHYGLTFMSERARLVGGSVIVNSEVQVGTKIYVSVPL